MIFTTVKKKVEKEELFPNDAVMTLIDNKFSLNKKAMELFGFPLNTANTSKIANGYDENNNIVLVNMDTNDMYTNNITAKNDFSSQLLATRLSKQFKLGEENYFQLNLIEDDLLVKYVGVELINAVNVPFQSTDTAADDLTENIFEYPFVETIDEDLAAIEALHSEDIAQQDEVIEELPSVCAGVEVAPKPEIPVGIANRVINTESW